MAEIERGEHGDSGAARSWMDRAVRAPHDPAWTADGYVSEQWRPVSPVTGRLDAFQWMVPVAALPSARAGVIEVAAGIPERPFAHPAIGPDPDPARAGEATMTPVGPADSSPSEGDVVEVGAVAAGTGTTRPNEALSVEATPVEINTAEAAMAPPMFRPRRDFGAGTSQRTAVQAIPEVVPLVHAPDDPGVDMDEFDPDRPMTGQVGGFRGFLSRLMG
jgi:HemY protein